MVKGLKHALVGPRVLWRMEAVGRCALGLDLGQEGVAVQRRVPRKGAAGEERERDRGASRVGRTREGRLLVLIRVMTATGERAIGSESGWPCRPNGSANESERGGNSASGVCWMVSMCSRSICVHAEPASASRRA